MKEYKCIACGEVKKSIECCTCPVCGYMMYELPNERKTVIINEIAKFIRTIIYQKINLDMIDFKELSADLNRFPSFDKIKSYVTKANKTEEFYKRLQRSAEQMKQYFHESFNKTYIGENQSLEDISNSTVEFLSRILPELGVNAKFDKTNFPIISLDYSETANQKFISSADALIEKILQLSDKIYQFIRVNNIYGCAYDISTKSFKFKEPEYIDWKIVMDECISACDKVLAKKYIVDLFEDGSTELTEMLEVTWNAVSVLLSAPVKSSSWHYHQKNEIEWISAETCTEKLNSIYLRCFDEVLKIVNDTAFLTDKNENELFALYNKMLDFDIYHYMTGTKGSFTSGANEQKLDNLIGLENIKSSIRKMKAYAISNKDNTEFNLHMCFLGNPGTGKTEVARIIAGILHENGLLPTDTVIETDRSGLVAGYVGQTALKTSDMIEKAMGGVLFIDEAYSLIQSDSSNDYGHEAVSTLIKAMEDYRGKFCVILAGYKNQMNDMIAKNPGFQSRIQFTLNFPNYNRKELSQIMDIMLKARGYFISDSAKERILDITDYKRKEPNFANAREVRNILEQIIMCQNVRCAGTSDKALEIVDVNTYIRDEHINIPTSSDGVVKKILSAEEELDTLVGLRSVKRMIKKIKAYAKRNKSDPDLNLHMSFCGNPGTGKTEVARILSRILYEAGVLPEAKLTEMDSGGLISKYVGETASKTLNKINDAMGGVLFIDEAYSLTQNTDNGTAGYGDEAVAVLLKQMEDKRGQFCVILAGYKNKMDEFIGTNPGFSSRIQFSLEFPDYDREELSEIAVRFLQKKKYTIDDNALALVLDITDYYRARPNFANARTVRNILEQVIMNQNLRTEDASQVNNQIIKSDVEDFIMDENIDLHDISCVCQVESA